MRKLKIITTFNFTFTLVVLGIYLAYALHQDLPIENMFLGVKRSRGWPAWLNHTAFSVGVVIVYWVRRARKLDQKKLRLFCIAIGAWQLIQITLRPWLVVSSFTPSPQPLEHAIAYYLSASVLAFGIIGSTDSAILPESLRNDLS